MILNPSVNPPLMKQMCLVQCTVLKGHMYLSDVWWGANSRTNIKNIYDVQRLKYVLKFLTI